MNQELTTQAEACLSALSARFASRGLVQSALQGAKEQIETEEKTRELAPRAYRMSLLPEATLRGVYRRGKEHMSGEDLLRYVEEGRRMDRQGKDFADCPSVYETARALAPEPARADAPEGLRAVSAHLHGLPARTAKTVRERLPLWFSPQRADGSAERRRFPLSAFAAVAAVAVSMMLIVSGALMVTGAETRISTLHSEIAELNGEIADLKSDLESTVDLMEIRRIAVEEYGMVEEEYLRMDYIALDSSDAVEIFEKEKDKSVGLSALLSAIGLKK